MNRLSDRAIEIVNALHTERLDYNSEYIPLIDALNQLHAYEDAEEAGTLVRMPCKAGDTVYWCNNKNKISNGTVVGIQFNAKFGKIKIANCDSDFTESIEGFGKTVFLTPEAAEAALKLQEDKLDK